MLVTILISDAMRKFYHVIKTAKKKYYGKIKFWGVQGMWSPVMSSQWRSPWHPQRWNHRHHWLQCAGTRQALNLRDNGFNVIIGQRKDSLPGGKPSTMDGWRWKPLWNYRSCQQSYHHSIPLVRCCTNSRLARGLSLPHRGKALYFSHGFGVTYADHYGHCSSVDIDVILVAPKGLGYPVFEAFSRRQRFKLKFCHLPGCHRQKPKISNSPGHGCGFGISFETDFRKKCTATSPVNAAASGEPSRVYLKPQYNELRKRGHSPSEAFGMKPLKNLLNPHLCP